MLLDALNAFAAGDHSPSGVAAACRSEWLRECAMVLGARIAEERWRSGRRITVHANNLERLIETANTGTELSRRVRGYFAGVDSAERHYLPNLLPLLRRPEGQGAADFVRRVTLMRRLLRAARESQRAWRRRLTKAPDLLTAVETSRRRFGESARARADLAGRPAPILRVFLSASEIAALQPLQAEFEALWRRAVRRCEYVHCAIPGGRYYVGRSKECLECRSAHSRVTGFRHRKAAHGFKEISVALDTARET
jgi:hypothetical protein